MSYCSDCGSKLESGERFCGNCGKGQQADVKTIADRRSNQGPKRKKIFGLAGLVVLAFVVVGVIMIALPGTSIEGTYVLVEDREDPFAVGPPIGEITFKDGTVSGPDIPPGFTYEVRDRTIYVWYQGVMIAMFEIIDADTIQSDVPGFAGVFKRR